MIDYTNSEFSRIRFQWNNNKLNNQTTDNQFISSTQRWELMVHINIKIGKAPVSGLIAALSVLSAASFAADNINILACEPEWASLAEELGVVMVFSATHAKQNPHFIRARPSLIRRREGPI